MALLGQKTAFIPIGLSCQTAWQLNRHRHFLSFLLGESFDQTSSFFDWTIVSSEHLPPIIERLAAQPIDARSWDRPRKAHHALMLRKRRLWLWHEKPMGEMTDVDFAAIISKFEHLRQKFLGLAALPRRVFVASAGQNNLFADYPYRDGDLRLRFSNLLVERLRETLDTLFPDGENHLLIAGKPRWVASVDGAFALPEEHSDWEGNDADWRHVLFAFLTRELPELQAQDGDTPHGSVLSDIGQMMHDLERLRRFEPPGVREGEVETDALHRRLTKAMREREALAHHAAQLETQLAGLRRFQRIVRLEPLRDLFRR